MPSTYTHKFDTPVYKGDVTIHTGLFIEGKWVDPVEEGSIELVLPLLIPVIALVLSTYSKVSLTLRPAKLSPAFQ